MTSTIGSGGHPLPGTDPRPGVFGAGALARLPELVAELGMTRILLVTGRASFTASGATSVLPELQRIAEVTTWSDFAPNPRVEDLIAGTEILAATNPDGIVAIGGGSVLDMAKLLSAVGGLDSAQIHTAIRTNTVAARTNPLILVPTTSGSGAETTHFAVVYIGAEKYSLAHPSLLPDAVVLDPLLTTSASSYQKATSVIDAIAQAVESHWARGATPTSRAHALQALTELVAAAPAYVHGDTAAATPAALGSHLAGRAIDLSKTTGPHAMAYGLTKNHGVPHGHAVATTLGAFARHHAAAVRRPAAGADPATDLAADLEIIATVLGADSIDDIGTRLDRIAGELGLELRLRNLGVAQADLDPMARAVNHERLGNNPIALTPAALAGILQECW